MRGAAGVRVIAGFAWALACGACAAGGAHTVPVTSTLAPAADSITLALWHLDETGGTACADAGVYHMDGTAGLDTHTDFGRFGNARAFTSSLESWVFVPYSNDLNTRRVTVEAWISPGQLGLYEDTPIVGRWSEYGGEQSWLFSLVGLQSESRLTHVEAPGFHENYVLGATPGHLMFLVQPDDPVPPQVFFSTREIPLQRWTHVAVTDDGQVVRFYVNGQLDAQFAVRSTIRASQAPLVIGNYFDTRTLSSFGGDLQVGGRVTLPPVYAFQGMIDEVRISSQAREGFERVR